MEENVQFGGKNEMGTSTLPRIIESEKDCCQT